MARTTIDIDDAVLCDLKRLQKQEGKTLGRLISELLGSSLARRGGPADAAAPPFQWTARAMRARIDLEDKEAVRAAIESS